MSKIHLTQDHGAVSMTNEQLLAEIHNIRNLVAVQTNLISGMANTLLMLNEHFKQVKDVQKQILERQEAINQQINKEPIQH